ncbi:MAG: hypothetical protein KF753_11975 [Caldilineaceae bacterium]|nr:hypothetical protein [Caldilineaceae bacterium]
MNYFRMLIWILFAAVLGAGVGALWNEALLGGVSGVLLGWSVGQAIQTRKRRWWAIAALLLCYLAAWELTGLSGLAIALICTGITLFLSAAVLRDLYAGSEMEAFVHHLKILTGLNRGFHIVSEGKSVVPAGSDSVFGPRLIIVKPNTGAILESGPRHTQTLGPGICMSRPFEYIKEVFDLRPKTERLRVAEVRTKDHLQVTVQVSLLLRIDIRAAVRQGSESISESEQRKLQHIYSYHQDWVEAAKQEVISHVRRYVSARTLDAILDPGHYDAMARDVIRNSNKRVNKWGVRVDRAIVESIQPRPEVAARMEEKWVESLRRQSFAEAERSRAYAWSDAVRIMAEGYRVAKENNMPQDAIQREIVRRTLEKIASEPGLNALVGSHIAGEIDYLRRAVGIT